MSALQKARAEYDQRLQQERAATGDAAGPAGRGIRNPEVRCESPLTNLLPPASEAESIFTCLLCRKPGLMTDGPGRSVLPLAMLQVQLAWACANRR